MASLYPCDMAHLGVVLAIYVVPCALLLGVAAIAPRSLLGIVYLSLSMGEEH